jgi:hypothetical protein
MPCLEITDLSHLADSHINAQRATIKNLRARRTDLEAEEKALATQPHADTNPRLKQVREAVNHLRLELDGEVESPPGSRIFTKDPKKKSAEDRVEVMAALYRERSQFVFRDTTKADKERIASVFGLPTVQEMQRLQNKEAADALMTRASSLLLGRGDTRNPVDFLDTEGLEVKVALANTVEHHHIYNNVHLDENGRVEFKSFKIRQDRTTGELTLDIVPSYWNSEKHGRNTQFIGLLDGMHSGDDPVTHMHYYKFSDAEAKAIKDKIRSDAAEITREAKSRAGRLESQLTTLKARATNPKEYEQGLGAKIKAAEAELTAAKAAAKGLLSKPKSTLSPEQLALREAHDGKAKELRSLSKDLTEHRTLTNLKSDIEATNTQLTGLEAKAKAIKLTDYPKGPERDAKKLERQALENEVWSLKRDNKNREKLLKEKGDISQQIKDAERKLGEANAIASLTEDDAVKMFERKNGWFSFDKGSAEKADHEVYRPMMNSEITKYYVRETMDYLEREYGDNALEALQNISRNQYQNNILDRLSALQDKMRG